MTFPLLSRSIFEFFNITKRKMPGLAPHVAQGMTLLLSSLGCETTVKGSSNFYIKILLIDLVAGAVSERHKLSDTAEIPLKEPRTIAVSLGFIFINSNLAALRFR